MTSRPPRSTSGADGPPRQARARRAGPLIAIALATVAGVWAVVGSAWVLPELSANSDEGLYLLQAETLASGRLAPEAPSVDAASYQPWFSAERDGRYLLKYAPVHASVLAASDVATGSQRPALGAIAAAQVALVIALALELGAGHRAALLAGGALRARAARAAARHHLPVLRHQPRPPARGRHPHRACVAHGSTLGSRRRGALLGVGGLRSPLRRRAHGRGDDSGRGRGAGASTSRSVAAAGTLGWPGRPRCGGSAAGVARLQPRHDR